MSGLGGGSRGSAGRVRTPSSLDRERVEQLVRLGGVGLVVLAGVVVVLGLRDGASVSAALAPAAIFGGPGLVTVLWPSRVTGAGMYVLEGTVLAVVKFVVGLFDPLLGK